MTNLLRPVLQFLASLKLTLWVIALLLGCVVWAYRIEGDGTWILAVPFALFSINLLAAIATQPKFRTQVWLLGFHLCLLSIVVLVTIGRLTYLKAHTEVSTGQAFGGELSGIEQGPLHPGGYERLRFLNGGFEIDYLPGVRRNKTHNRVRWDDSSGQVRTALIGDHTPLVLDGYRFYTTFNKGFAPVFAWLPDGGTPVLGTIHLPSWPLNEYSQSQEWQPPGATAKIWMQLQFDDLILDPERSSSYRVPNDPVLVLRVDGTRTVLHPGEQARVSGGSLRFEGVTTWMGYQVFYDPTIPWLLAASALAVICLGAHFMQKFRGRSWQQNADGSALSDNR